MNKRITLSVSVQNHEKLRSIQKKIERILKRDVSLDEVLSIVLAVKSIDEVLSELLIEGGEDSS